MASAEHLELSDFIKSVHQNLREATKKIGFERAWQTHCKNKEYLRKYADAMKKLACQHWEQNIDSKIESRIQWMLNTSSNYFTNDIFKLRCKENDICTKIDCAFDTSDLCDREHVNKLTLLDVGSCYNPFNKYDVFEVTAIDIAPATNEVFKCDFLSLKVGDSFTVKDNELSELPKCHFNVVVFSLLLEYFPIPNQRLLCCEKAYNLLKPEGILVIITPDSNHVGVNAKYMKSWRYILAKMGFSRIKYEKLLHIHCMAFRKSVCKAVASRWAELQSSEQFFEELYIPQDFNTLIKSNEDVDESVNICDKNDAVDFSELPGCDIFQ